MPAEVTNSPEGYVTGFAGPVSHGYCSHLGGEPVEQRAALAHVAQLSQDFCGTAVTCTLEGHSDLPIGRRIDESLDAPREPVDLIDQGLEYSHQDSLPNRRLVRVNSTTSVSSIAALNGPAVINRWAVL